MWIWLEGDDEPVNQFIPEDAESSTGEFDNLRSEISYYWHGVQKYLATGDDSYLAYFAGANIDDRNFQLDLDEIESAANADKLDFDPIDSGGGE